MNKKVCIDSDVIFNYSKISFSGYVSVELNPMAIKMIEVLRENNQEIVIRSIIFNTLWIKSLLDKNMVEYDHIIDEFGREDEIGCIIINKRIFNDNPFEKILEIIQE